MMLSKTIGRFTLSVMCGLFLSSWNVPYLSRQDKPAGVSCLLKSKECAVKKKGIKTKKESAGATGQMRLSGTSKKMDEPILPMMKLYLV